MLKSDSDFIFLGGGSGLGCYDYGEGVSVGVICNHIGARKLVNNSQIHFQCTTANAFSKSYFRGGSFLPKKKN